MAGNQIGGDETTHDGFEVPGRPFSQAQRAPYAPFRPPSGDVPACFIINVARSVSERRYCFRTLLHFKMGIILRTRFVKPSYFPLSVPQIKSIRCSPHSSLRIRRSIMSTSSSSSANSLAVPRPSASLIVVNERNEILLVHRNPKARSFGGMTVFPGGNYDKKQDTSLAVTAMRETFEETGLLLVSADDSSTATQLDEAQLEDARHRIHQQKLLWRDFLDSHRLRADINALLPFTQWITPKGAPRRFHTQFFITFLPATPSTGFNSGEKHEHIPKPDGGQEIISARFVHPIAILREFRDGKITLMPPQFYLLTTLVNVLQGASNTEEQRMKVGSISRGNFGRLVFNPLPLKTEGEDRINGHLILTYEGDETRGGPPGRLHRAKCRMGNGIVREITLQRNFDILDGIDSHSSSQSSKL